MPPKMIPKGTGQSSETEQTTGVARECCEKRGPPQSALLYANTSTLDVRRFLCILRIIYIRSPHDPAKFLTEIRLRLFQ